MSSMWASERSLKMGGVDVGGPLGQLSVKLHSASGLKAKDINGKSDPYVIASLERVERLLLEMREMHEMQWESDHRKRHKASGRESSFTRSVKEINGLGEESRGESRNVATARPDDRKAPEATHTQGESRPGHSRPRHSSGERREHHRHSSREHPGRSTSSITKEHTHTRERAHNGSPVLASHKLRA